MTADQKYAVAMAESDSLLLKMRAAEENPDVVIALLADIWMQRHNVPFVTTVYEAAQEMSSPMKQG